jgi:hypothetical protein
MSAQYDICIPVLCLPSCMIFTQLYDFCSSVHMMSAYFYDLFNAVMSARLCDVRSTTVYGVSLSVKCLLNCMMSA